MHIHHLSTSQQAVCEHNPTYYARLATLKGLHHQIEGAQRMLVTGHTPTQASGKQVTEWKRQLQELEYRFMDWDDELASLAEALLAKPK